MKTISGILFLGFTSFSVSAFAVANFTGHWVSNSGKVSSNVGLGANCTKIEIIIEQTETEIVTKKYHSTCGFFGSDWGPNTMQIQNGKVFENGDEVGYVNDTTLISITPDVNVLYAFNLKLTQTADGKPAVQSYYGVKNGVGAIATEGILEKVEP